MSDNETDKPVNLDFIGRRLDAVNNNVNDMRRSVIALQSRFDGMEARFGAMEARFGSMEARFGLLETRLGSLETRFDSMQTRIISVESGIERLEFRPRSSDGPGRPPDRRKRTRAVTPAECGKRLTARQSASRPDRLRAAGAYEPPEDVPGMARAACRVSRRKPRTGAGVRDGGPVRGAAGSGRHGRVRPHHGSYGRRTAPSRRRALNRPQSPPSAMPVPAMIVSANPCHCVDRYAVSM